MVTVRVVIVLLLAACGPKVAWNQAPRHKALNELRWARDAFDRGGPDAQLRVDRARALAPEDPQVKKEAAELQARIDAQNAGARARSDEKQTRLDAEIDAKVAAAPAGERALAVHWGRKELRKRRAGREHDDALLKRLNQLAAEDVAALEAKGQTDPFGPALSAARLAELPGLAPELKTRAIALHDAAGHAHLAIAARAAGPFTRRAHRVLAARALGGAIDKDETDELRRLTITLGALRGCEDTPELRAALARPAGPRQVSIELELTSCTAGDTLRPESFEAEWKEEGLLYIEKVPAKGNCRTVTGAARLDAYNKGGSCRFENSTTYPYDPYEVCSYTVCDTIFVDKPVRGMVTKKGKVPGTARVMKARVEGELVVRGVDGRAKVHGDAEKTDHIHEAKGTLKADPRSADKAEALLPEARADLVRTVHFHAATLVAEQHLAEAAGLAATGDAAGAEEARWNALALGLDVPALRAQYPGERVNAAMFEAASGQRPSFAPEGLVPLY